MIPLFASHYSGKSILTLETPDKVKEGQKQSVFSLCKEAGIERPFVVENKFTGAAELFKNGKKCDIHPRFGLRYPFVHENIDDNKDNWHKIVIFIKSTAGYKDLIRLHNRANLDEKGVITPAILEKYWTENLKLVIPFYDSYIFNNVIYGKSCQPEFGGIPHDFFVENNCLPFDSLVESYITGNKIKAKTILYKNRADFDVWQTFRCALNLNVKGKKRTLEAPQFEHCHSKEFCLESYLENK